MNDLKFDKIVAICYSRHLKPPLKATAAILNPRYSLQRGILEKFQKLSEYEKRVEILAVSKSRPHTYKVNP
jgi:hypothetical protein